jgi:hypothetical protein
MVVAYLLLKQKKGTARFQPPLNQLLSANAFLPTKLTYSKLTQQLIRFVLIASI